MSDHSGKTQVTGQLAVAAIQQACSQDKAASLATTEMLVREAAAGGAQLIVLQELHATPHQAVVIWQRRPTRPAGALLH